MKYWYKIYFLYVIYLWFLDFGPIEIKISDTFGESVRIFWNWAPSCYSIQGFQFTYSRGIMTQKYKY